MRKAYGLGAQAMLGAGSLVGFFSVAWPTAEFAGMNIEGAVKLGYRKELMAIEDPEERRAGVRTAARSSPTTMPKRSTPWSGGGIDDVIDPAETRQLDRQQPEAAAAGAAQDAEEISVYRPVVIGPRPVVIA